MTVSVLAPGWEICMDASPDWLFLRLVRSEIQADDSPQIAEGLWQIAEQRRVHRLVVEIDPGTMLSSYLIGQLVLLHKRTMLHGGVLRLCGLSQEKYSILELMHLAGRLPNYADREAAVMGWTEKR